jgi:hypothetical protein
MQDPNAQQQMSGLFQTDTGEQPVAKMTKRDWIAAMCLQGILANKNTTKTTMWSTAQSAVMYADQLIAALESDLTAGVPMVQPPAFPGLSIPVVASASD